MIRFYFDKIKKKEDIHPNTHQFGPIEFCTSEHSYQLSKIETDVIELIF